MIKLYSIVRKVGKDLRYKIIDRSACTRIRKLHLNKRGKRGGKRLKHPTHRLGLIPEGANSSNLIHIKMDTRQSMRDLKLNLTLSLLNAQLIKNKELVYNMLKNQYGIDGKALNWYDSYLCPRSCMVQVKGSTSTLQPLEFSVPQGSCGGPVLYSAYASILRLVVSPPLNLNGFTNDLSINISFKAKDQDQ